MADFIYVSKEPSSDELTNKLAELGWNILIPMPLVIYKEKQFPPDSEFVRPFVERIEKLATENYGYRKALHKEGVKFKRIHCEDTGKNKYVVTDKGNKELHRWRLEVNTEDVDDGRRVSLYATFASPNINFPAFYNADIIDENFPEIMSEISDLFEREEYKDD